MTKKKIKKNKKKSPVNTYVAKQEYNSKTKKMEITEEKGSELEEENNTSQGMLQPNRMIVGLSKGITLNLGNYESAKISCWMSKNVPEEEKDIMNALNDISEMIDEQIQFEAEELKN